MDKEWKDERGWEDKWDGSDGERVKERLNGWPEEKVG